MPPLAPSTTTRNMQTSETTSCTVEKSHKKSSSKCRAKANRQVPYIVDLSARESYPRLASMTHAATATPPSAPAHPSPVTRPSSRWPPIPRPTRLAISRTSRLSSMFMARAVMNTMAMSRLHSGAGAGRPRHDRARRFVSMSRRSNPETGLSCDLFKHLVSRVGSTVTAFLACSYYGAPRRFVPFSPRPPASRP